MDSLLLEGGGQNCLVFEGFILDVEDLEEKAPHNINDGHIELDPGLLVALALELGQVVNDERINGEETGIDLQELELHLVVYNLHSVVMIHPKLVLEVQENQQGKAQQKDERALEGEQNYK